MLRALLALQRDPLAFFTHLASSDGDVARLPIPFRRTYLLNHPDDVRDLFVGHAARVGRGLAIERAKLVLGEGLLTIDGEQHRRHRRLMQPGFGRPEVERHVPQIAAVAESHSRRWSDGDVVDVAHEMAVLTLEAVAYALFGEDISASAVEVTDALDELLEFSRRLVLPLSAAWRVLPTASNRRARTALATLDAVLYGLIEQKRRKPPGNDVLSMLMAAGADGGTSTQLTDRELRDEAMTLLLAGHETTACALTWTWHLLAAHPEAVGRMRDETEAALGMRTMAAADLTSLAYVEQVFAEAMRLYPPVWSVGRRVLADLEIRTATIPPGSVVVLSQWVMQRDGHYWPEPERFDPARFEGSRRPRQPRPAYFPFGDGARRCIGESLAWTIGVTVLATLIRELRFERVADLDIVPQTYLFLLYPGYRSRSSASTRIRRGLPMRFVRE